jgi:hypothetical protein
MKKKDIAIIIVVFIVSATMSIIISGLIITPAEDRQQSVEVVPVIQGSLNEVDKRYFNENSVNPAQDIQIGRDPNSNPFAGQ